MVKANWVLMLPAVALAIVLLVLGLSAKDLWYDEAFSVAFAQLHWNAFATAIQQTDGSFALYYAILHLWLHIGTSAAFVRAFSVICAVATIPVIFTLARMLFGTRVAVFASLLLAANSFFVQYGQEARSYALFLLASSAATLLFVRCTRDPSRPNLTLYSVLTVLAIHAHPYAGLTLASHALSLALPQFRRNARALGIAMAAACVGCIPLAIVLAHDGPGQISWLPTPSLELLAAVYTNLAGDRLLLVLYGALAIVAMLGIGRALPERRDALIALVVWCFVPVILIFAASFVKPLLFPRYMIGTLAPLVVLVAVGCAALRTRTLVTVVSLMLALGSAGALHAYYHDTFKFGWRSAVDAIAADPTPRRGVLILPQTAAFPFDYAEKERGTPPGAHIAFPDRPFPIWVDKVAAATLSPERLTHILREYPDLWSVSVKPDGALTMRDVVQTCRLAGEHVDEQQYSSVIIVHCQVQQRTLARI